MSEREQSRWLIDGFYLGAQEIFLMEHAEERKVGSQTEEEEEKK